MFQGATLVYDIVVRPVIIAAASKAKELPALTPFAEKFLLSEVQAGQDKKTKATSSKISSAFQVRVSMLVMDLRVENSLHPRDLGRNGVCCAHH